MNEKNQPSHLNRSLLIRGIWAQLKWLIDSNWINKLLNRFYHWWAAALEILQGARTSWEFTWAICTYLIGKHTLALVKCSHLVQTQTSPTWLLQICDILLTDDTEHEKFLRESLSKWVWLEELRDGTDERPLTYLASSNCLSHLSDRWFLQICSWKDTSPPPIFWSKSFFSCIKSIESDLTLKRN